MILFYGKEFKDIPVVIKDIAVLVYYNGQKEPLLYHLKERQIDKKRKWDFDETPIEISSVDGFQGREERFIIVDIVGAANKQAVQQSEDEEDEEDELDDGTESYTKPTNRLTQHVRNMNRLMFALTRGMDGCVVVGNMQSMILQKDRGSPETLALSEMVKDFDRRKLIAHDYHNWDDQLWEDYGPYNASLVMS